MIGLEKLTDWKQKQWSRGGVYNIDEIDHLIHNDLDINPEELSVDRRKSDLYTPNKKFGKK